ncbi:uncharacterized protein LOC126777355 isoform X2 [Nymphalis io]|uniref:uncharacterized protein LOC126777355 isoform X2 n=1 Tax=Inachis io TaxID=171585 RepID=UPI00216854E4|nr:uncharacterized protein LOC126777355 isoform X2 [Nymphalis io]
MSFEVDRYTSAWAHIALCADVTWASEPPDDFIVANQRLWTQHCRVSHVLQDTGIESAQDLTSNKHLVALQDNGSRSRRSVKDVIPESRLAQFYGNFYYDDVRENCYTCSNEKGNVRYNGHGCENSDLTECWMLPEVEYWFRKLVDNSDRAVPRRRRQCKMLTDSDFERWNSSAERVADEAALEARIRSVRPLWNQHSVTYQGMKTARAPSPPPAPRKIRARRRQPKSLAALAPPPPSYCVDAPTKLFCDPTYKFQFDVTRPPQLTDYQRAMGRLSASVQALMRSSASRCPTYRGTNVSRYAPTIPRPTRFPEKRYGVWWPRENQNRLNQKNIINQVQNMNTGATLSHKSETTERKDEPDKEVDQTSVIHTETEENKSEITHTQQKDNLFDDGQLPSTSSAAQEDLRKKRLYSTVLSTSVAPPIHLNRVGCIRFSNDLNTPGLIKLNPKIAVSSRIRIPIVDNKFEELEKEALEQYKDSDESIDTKFRELEKQAVEQYSTSNSNTSCSSDNSGKKKTVHLPSNCESKKEKRLQKSQDDKSVDSVVIYSQNFPDLNAKGQSNSLNLKNFHIPPRGEKKELVHRLNKCFRNVKNYSKRAASDTDNEARDTTVKGSKANKGSMRWTLHVIPPKKRHLTLSDFSSDEEIKENSGSIKDAGPCIKKHLSGKVKMSAHGGGDLHPIIRKT